MQISPLWDSMPYMRLWETEDADGADTDKGTVSPFADIFTTAIDAVKETNADKVQAEYLLATGELDNPAELTIAAAKELQATQLLVKLRDTALDAYNELMRISI